MAQNIQYDRVTTAKVIEIFYDNVHVRKVLFNDMSIPHVRMAKGHDDHFHIELTLQG